MGVRMAMLLYSRMSAILREPRGRLPRLPCSIGVVIALAAGALFAQTPAPAPVDPAPPSPAAIVAALKSGGYIVYFRHTATDFSQSDEKMRDFDDCANQRNLTDGGRDQAKRIGEAWRRLSIPVGRVLASPFCRTREVAQLAFGRYERALEARGGPGTAGDPVRYQPLSRLLESAPKRGTNSVIVSHGNPYQALHPGTAYLREGEAAIIRPLPGGGHEVYGRIAWDEWPSG
jgi:phosphohistidine phosphatase SixA